MVVKPRSQRRAGEATQAVVSAGQAVPAIGDVERDLAERDGDHGEIDAAAPHDQQAEQRAGQPAQQHPGEHGQRRAGGEIFQRQAGAVRAQAEIGGMAEAHDAGEAQQQVERHGGKAEDQDAAGQVRYSRPASAARTGRSAAAPR